MTISDEKRALRAELIRRRKDIPKAEKTNSDLRIFEKLIPLIRDCSGVFTYVSTEMEVDTRRLLDWCFEKGIPTAVPVSGDHELTFYPIHAFSDLDTGRFGILEPVDRKDPAVPDEYSVCIVPALLCDESGLRLGYGRGYYDRYLSGFPGRSVIICYSDFVGNVPAEPHDKRADMVITD